VALALAKDEYSRSIRLLEIINLIDKDNPIKLLKEANIYGLIGNKEKQKEIISKIESIFPKYFVSHFRFSDMYQDKDLLEISFLLELEVFDKQGLFLYPFRVLEGYKNHLEGHIVASKECFEKAITINPTKPEGYVLLAQTLQLMSGYDSSEYRIQAEENYKKAMEIYQKENLLEKVEDMKRQLKHLNSSLNLK
jgi:tetratricopeptide (TPR) repeat protein